MAGSDVVLRVENVSKYFGRIAALRGVSFELERGKILGLVGDNGAGKSTLLKIIAGVLKPTSGKIYLDGREVRFRNAAEAMARGIAITYQFLELVDTAKVWENFYMGREVTKRIGPIKLLNINFMRNKVKDCLTKYGINLDVDTEVGQLTGEEKQLLAIARAVETNPKILLLDESFTYLSIEGRERVCKLLRKINEEHGVTIIVVSHDLDLVKRLSDDIMVLREGRKVFYGPVSQVTIDDIIGYMLGTIPEKTAL